MTTKEIKELLEIFHESGVAEMEVQRGENRLRLRRLPTLQDLTVPGPIVAAAAAQPNVPATHASAPPAKPSEPDPNHIIVKSPIVGTYYDAPSPGAPQFVKVGDSVEPGQALCIIESMKLMNEIEAEIAGTIVHKLVESGRPVEYGEALFAIKPR
jgi:acetyl-CoA carboxylase biotin carboxyl carrier protein